MLQSVADFIRSSDEGKLSDPNYVLSSTANYIALAEKILRERYVNKETAVGYHMFNAISSVNSENGKPNKTGPVDPSDEDEKVPINIQEDRKKIDEIGFYQHTVNRKEAEKMEQGQFYIDNGKMYYGASDKREPVSYSNWYAGNVDPEQMTRHKELLDRQHFSGPFWEKRPLPRSVMDETFQEYMTGVEEEPAEAHPKDQGLKPKDDAFEKVKR